MPFLCPFLTQFFFSPSPLILITSHTHTRWVFLSSPAILSLSPLFLCWEILGRFVCTASEGEKEEREGRKEKKQEQTPKIG